MSEEDKKKKIESVEKALNMFISKDSKTDNSKGDIQKAEKVKQTGNLEESKAEFSPVQFSHEEPKPEPIKEIKGIIEEELIPEVEAVSKKESASSGSKKTFPLEKLRENLNPELKEAIQKLSGTIPKASVNKLLNEMETNSNIIFNSNITPVFENLSSEDAKILSKKLAEWDIPQDASEINASVILAWLNKTKK
jgi:hypothetical protein